MRKAIYALLAVGALAAVSTAATTTSAEAWGGCGPGRHPTPWGCRWNGPGWGGPVYRYGWHRPWGWHRHW
jgi:Spy/CpxP family protein refolding chaperone